MRVIAEELSRNRRERDWPPSTAATFRAARIRHRRARLDVPLPRCGTSITFSSVNSSELIFGSSSKDVEARAGDQPRA